MANFEDLKRELEQYKNTLVIGQFNDIVRLVNVIDDGFDYLWEFDSSERIYYASCVGGWVPLKGFIKQEDYDGLVYVWNLNNINKAV